MGEKNENQLDQRKTTNYGREKMKISQIPEKNPTNYEREKGEKNHIIWLFKEIK